MQWFTIAETIESWSIPVLYDEFDSHHVIFMSFDKPEIATVIPEIKQIDPYLVETFQEAIRNL